MDMVNELEYLIPRRLGWFTPELPSLLQHSRSDRREITAGSTGVPAVHVLSDGEFLKEGDRREEREECVREE